MADEQQGGIGGHAFVQQQAQEIATRIDIQRRGRLISQNQLRRTNQGTRCGDTLLIGVAKRLRSAMGPAVMLARISADTFALFGPENGIDPVAVRRAFEAPFFVHGHALVVQMRMGIVRVADSKGSAVELLRNANLAVNQARHAGGGACCWFSRNMSEDVQVRVAGAGRQPGRGRGHEAAPEAVGSFNAAVCCPSVGAAKGAGPGVRLKSSGPAKPR